ncbi:alpha/beta fold hydrolase [Ferviditalea candida]|uniref:Alpha/beta fold hydrolase n=1 Tax=Ferviditalea candida TaxID=3108399 RepID=A0ABU5ZIA5_9BACL|nr:alpha/beta fold hydrolase [Paenibacillaceae bacterium T2]
MNARILWIHGWGMSSGIFAHAVRRLEGFEHHFVSFADCAKPEQLLPAVLGKLRERSGPWTVIGWSMGAMLALESLFAAAVDVHPECGNAETRKNSEVQIDSLIVIAGTLGFASADRMKGWPPRVLERMKKQLAGERPEAVLEAFKRSMFSPEEIASQPDRIETAAACPADFGSEGLQAGLDYLLRTDLASRWDHWFKRDAVWPGRLRWIHGEQDAICPVGAVPELPDRNRIIFPGTGHAPFLTREAEFIHYIKEFLQ